MRATLRPKEFTLVHHCLGRYLDHRGTCSVLPVCFEDTDPGHSTRTNQDSGGGRGAWWRERLMGDSWRNEMQRLQSTLQSLDMYVDKGVLVARQRL